MLYMALNMTYILVNSPVFRGQFMNYPCSYGTTVNSEPAPLPYTSGK